MSTIKSSAENLTLNADGANNDIKFQSNGSEVASIDQAGTITATTFTGAATDATKLPLAGGTMTGNLIVDTNLTVKGGVAKATDTATAIAQIGTNDASDPLALKFTARTGQGTGNYIAMDCAEGTADRHFILGYTAGERIRFPSTGGITFNGDTAAANALDDYEEGTWTPTFYSSGIGSHALNYAYYVKIGRLVTINMYVYNFGSISGGGVSFGITSLPFTQNVQALGPVTATHTNYNNAYGHAVARLYNGVAYIEQTQDAASGHWLPYSSFNANSHVQMSITYETAQ